MIAKNPAKSLKKPRPRRAKDKAAPETAVTDVIRSLTAQLGNTIYRDVFGQLHHEPDLSERDILAIRDLFVVVFLYETGARASELARLGTVVMTRAIERGNTTYCVTATGKTNDRDVRFTTATAELWELWYAVRPAGMGEYAIFSLQPTRPPAPLSSSAISQILVRRCREAGVTVFRSHSLRHAKVRRARQLFGLEMASLLIDHSSLEMTRNYANIDDTEVNNAVLRTGLQMDLWGGRRASDHSV